MPPIIPMSALMSALRGAGRQHLTASTVAARKAITGSHLLRLNDYTKVIRKKVPTGECFESAPFGVGDHRWRIVCYPNGADREHHGYTSLFIKSLSPHDEPFAFDATTARLQASVLDGAGKPWRTHTAGHRSFLGYEAWGWKDFVKNDDLDNLADDCLTVLCDVTVDDLPLHAQDVTGSPPESTAAASPPLELPEELAEDNSRRSDTDEGTDEDWDHPMESDVTIHVGGETFEADKWVLEDMSDVFKAELQNTSELRISDMDAEVFEVLLEYVYLDGALIETLRLRIEEPKMAKGLLVAADRYELEHLKLTCGEALRKHVDVGSVATMLALAERHGCPSLKDKCMEFLSRPDNLRSFMATDGFERLKKDCPSAAAEIVAQRLP